jgi:hypothetical protein
VDARPSASLSWADDPASGSLAWGSSTALGLDLRARGPRGGAVFASAEASVEAAALEGSAAAAAWAAAGAGSLLVPPDSLLVPAWSLASAGSPPATLVAARIRTLWARLDAGWASLAIGRQVVSYGRGAYWSPVDLFAILDATGISPVKRGVDALRARAPLGATGGLDLVAIPAADPASGRYAARAYGSAAGADLGLLAARDGQAWRLGGDLKLDLELGLYAEALCSLTDSGGPAEFRAAAGADWSTGDFVFAAEYYFSGAGAADPYGAGRHNLYAALSWAASDLLRAALSGSGDLSSGGLSATLSLAWDAAQNAQATLYSRLSRSPSAPLPWKAELGALLSVKF